jgi:hypothetical protein
MICIRVQDIPGTTSNNFLPYSLLRNDNAINRIDDGIARQTRHTAFGRVIAENPPDYSKRRKTRRIAGILRPALGAVKPMDRGRGRK